jgi:hypothetical protein
VENVRVLVDVVGLVVVVLEDEKRFHLGQYVEEIDPRSQIGSDQTVDLSEYWLL